MRSSNLGMTEGGILDYQEYHKFGFLTTFFSHWVKLCITVSLSHTVSVETNESVLILMFLYCVFIDRNLCVCNENTFSRLSISETIRCKQRKIFI